MKTTIMTYPEKKSENNGNNVYVLVKMDSSSLEKGQKRKPIHLALILDRSGSMEGEKLDLTKEAACRFVNMLTRRDFISVIAYDTTCEIICPHTLLTDKVAITNRIHLIQSGASTNLSGGWVLGLSEIISGFTKDHFHYVMLLTDGLANEGVTEHSKLIQIGAKYLEKGIKTTTLGFGEDFDENLLKTISDNSGGRFYFVKGPEDIGQAFHSEFGEISRVVGQNLNVRFRTTEGVVIEEMYYNFPGEIKKTTFSLNLGDVLADDEKQILFKIQTPSSFSPAADVGKLTVSYFNIVDEMEPFSEELTIKGGEPDNTISQFQAKQVKQEIWLAISSRIKLKATEIAESGDITKAKEIIEHHIKQLDVMKIKSDITDAEKNRLISLLEIIDEKEISGMRKTLYHESYLMREKRGLYSRETGVDIIEDELIPQLPELIIEFEEKLRSYLGKRNYKNDSIDNICIVLNELLNNAFEHGCKNNPKGKVKVSIRIAPVHVKIIIKDPGKGFNYSKILKKLENENKDQHERGHGLMIVKGLCLRLNYSDNGSRVEAVIMKSRMQMESFITRQGEGFMTIDDIAVIRLIGSIELNNSHQVKDKIRNMIDYSYIKIILDMAGVTYMDSSGIGALLVLLKKLNNYSHGALVLAAPSQQVTKVLRLTRLYIFFTILPTVDDAIQYLRE